MKRSKDFLDTLAVIGLVLWLLLAPLGISFYLSWKESRNEGFLDTVRSGPAKAVASALRRGADPNTREIVEDYSRDSFSGMMEFVFRVHEADVRGARTALSFACENRNAGEVIPLLLRSGASIQEAQACTQPALSVAVQNGNEAAARILLENGVDLNSPNSNMYGFSPLQAAIMADNPRMVRLLLDHKATVVGVNMGSNPNGPNSAAIRKMLQKAAKP